MTAFALDSTGDLDFDASTGVFNMVDGDDALAQKLWLVLGINIGELAWNDNIGIAQQSLLLNGDNQSVVQSMISDYLEEQWPDTFDSITINDFDVDLQQRLTSFSATVKLMDGTESSASVSLDDGEGGDTNAND